MVKFDNGWQCVLGGLMIHLVLGSLYCWSNITMAVTSYLRLYDSSITYNDTMMVFTSQLAFQGLTMFAGGLLEKKVGSRYCTLIAGAILVLGTFCASLTTTLVGLVFTYGIPFGVGMGLCYTSPISASIRWNPRQKGLISGIIVAGFGGGAFLFGQIAEGIVNPDGENVDADTGYFPPTSQVPGRVPFMFFLLGCCYLFLYILGFCLIREKPDDPTGVSEGEGAGWLGQGQGQSGNYARCSDDIEASRTNPEAVVSALHAHSSALDRCSATGPTRSSGCSSTVPEPIVESPSAAAGPSNAYFGPLSNQLAALHSHLTGTPQSHRRLPEPSSASKAGVSGPVFTILGDDDDEDDDEEDRHTVIELSPLSTLNPNTSGSGGGGSPTQGQQAATAADSITSRTELCAAVSSSVSGAGTGTARSPSSAAAVTAAEGSVDGSEVECKVAFLPSEIIYFPLTWHIASCFVFTSAGGIYLAGTFKEYGEQYIRNEQFLSEIAASSSLFNAAGRIFWGEVADRTSPVTALLWLSASFALVIATYSNIALALGEFGYGLWTFGIFFCEGGNFSLYLPLLVQVYGSQHCAANYGVVFLVYASFVVMNIVLLTQITTISFSTVTLLISLATFAGYMNVQMLKRHIITFMGEMGSPNQLQS